MSSDTKQQAAEGNNNNNKQQNKQKGEEEFLTVVVFGASGDLATKKTFPALFKLFAQSLLPPRTQIIGYARSKLSESDFHTHITKHLPKDADSKHVSSFKSISSYFQGNYDKESDFENLSKQIASKEEGSSKPQRIFYLAVPPFVFTQTAQNVKAKLFASSNKDDQKKSSSSSPTSKIVIEKPFGRDLQSAQQLISSLDQLYTENDQYRIDHYLGKEMVQNLIYFRFQNNPLLGTHPLIWNSQFIKTILIEFKEDFGMQGRGEYFDKYGIIRDVMQNHLIQVLALLTMQQPESLSSDAIRSSKAKVLKSVKPLKTEDLVIGQYGKGKDEPAYVEDPTVEKGTVTPTFAIAVLELDTEQWKGTKFVLKCGKGLDERKAEVRIQFAQAANSNNNKQLFSENNSFVNELVLQIQPKESIGMNVVIKRPGLHTDSIQTKLTLSYKDDLEGGMGSGLPDAYEKLILDVVKGDHGLFVRSDELIAAWEIFDKVLNELEDKKVKPVQYDFGSSGPKEADELLKRAGFVSSNNNSAAPKSKV